MLHLQLYCCWCKHKAHLSVNTLCMDFLPEYFCTIMVTFVVVKGSLSFFWEQKLSCKKSSKWSFKYNEIVLNLTWGYPTRLHLIVPVMVCYMSECVFKRQNIHWRIHRRPSESLWKPFVTCFHEVQFQTWLCSIVNWFNNIAFFPPCNIKGLIMLVFDIFSANAVH